MSNERNVFVGPRSPYEPAKGGIGFELFRCLKKHKNKKIHVFLETGEVETYESLLKKSVYLAVFFKNKGLTKEDLVCLCSENRPNFAVPFVAAKFIGVNYASIEPTLPEEEMVSFLDSLQPKILFISDKIEEKIRKCVEKTKIEYYDCEVIVLGKCSCYKNFTELIYHLPENNEFRPFFIEDLKETAVIFLSSGTTGKPRGICCNHYSLLAQSFHLVAAFHGKGIVNLSNFQMKLDDIDVSTCIHYAAFYWISGMLAFLSFALIGGCCFIGTNFTSQSAYEAIQKYNPHTVFLPPGQVGKMCAIIVDKGVNPTVETFLTGGSLVDAVHMDCSRTFFPKAKIIQTYGLTETAGMVTGFNVKRAEDIELQKANPTSCGKACYGMSIKIVDLDTEKLLSTGEEGELRIKTPYMLNEYYQMDSSPFFDAGGWFKTGDLALINKDGLVFIKDRLKDVIFYSSYGILPSVIEALMYQHPAVLEAFAIGIPHPEDNERPMGVVLLKDEFKGKITEEEILQFVNQRVPSDRYELRAGVKIVNEMLRTPTGKLKKIEMKRRIIAKEL